MDHLNDPSSKTIDFNKLPHISSSFVRPKINQPTPDNKSRKPLDFLADCVLSPDQVSRMLKSKDSLNSSWESLPSTSNVNSTSDVKKNIPKKQQSKVAKTTIECSIAAFNTLKAAKAYLVDRETNLHSSAFVNLSHLVPLADPEPFVSEITTYGPISSILVILPKKQKDMFRQVIVTFQDEQGLKRFIAGKIISLNGVEARVEMFRFNQSNSSDNQTNTSPDKSATAGSKKATTNQNTKKEINTGLTVLPNPNSTDSLSSKGKAQQPVKCGIAIAKDSILDDLKFNRLQIHANDGPSNKHSERKIFPDSDPVTPNGKSNRNKGKRGSGGSSARTIYLPYISKAEVKDGLQKCTLYEGKLRFNKKNRHDAYVTAEKFESADGSSKDIFIPGMIAQNRALEGDLVIVELMKGDMLERQLLRVAEKRLTRMQDNKRRQKAVEISLPEVEDDEEEDEVLEENRVYGHVVFVVESLAFKRNHVGTLHMNKPFADASNANNNSQESRNIWFKPNDKRIPFIMIPKEIAPKEFLQDPASFDSMLTTCIIKRWPETSMHPYGDYSGKLGQMGLLPVESEALLVSAGIYWDTFSDDVLDSLPATPWTIPQEEFKKRLDLRGERIFSIDPATARDLDDAVSIKDLGDGTYEVGVHIADVSHFVQRDSILDQAAYERATSVYLTQKVIPMLPRLLCEELCSLNPDVDRFAFTVFWIFDSNGNILNKAPRFHKSIIRSCAKLSYDHAQAVIKGESWDSLPPVVIGNGKTKKQVSDDILQLEKFAKVLRQRRYENGSLTLNSIKLWFALDSDGNPNECGIYQIKDANRLIEEFMLLANIAVAHKLAAVYPEVALLRCHAPPDQSNLDDLAEDLKKYSIQLDTSSAKALHASFEAIPDQINRDLIRLLAIKKMKRANYFCAGAADIEGWRHYALGIPMYTHFTSPIRRYCDLVVHRMLEQAILGEADCGYDTDLVNGIAKQCNNRKNAAKDAQDASQSLYLATYLASDHEAKPIIDDHALVNRVSSRSVDVVLFKYGIEQTIWVEDVLDYADGMTTHAEGGLVIHWKDGSKQHIKMFSRISVLVSPDLSKSPPQIKLTMLPPSMNVKTNSPKRASKGMCEDLAEKTMTLSIE